MEKKQYINTSKGKRRIYTGIRGGKYVIIDGKKNYIKNMKGGMFGMFKQKKIKSETPYDKIYNHPKLREEWCQSEGTIEEEKDKGFIVGIFINNKDPLLSNTKEIIIGKDEIINLEKDKNFIENRIKTLTKLINFFVVLNQFLKFEFVEDIFHTIYL